MGRKRRYTDLEFIEAVRTSISITEALRKIGLRPSGGNSTHFKFIANELNVDWSHFKGMGHMAGKRHNHTPTTPLEKILVINSAHSSRNNIKRRLLKAGLMVYVCATCGIDEWKDKPLALHLDHVNGHPTDNRLENLRLLCPNCHSQTPTFCSKQRYDKKL